jgi:hypothetical protein
MKPGSLFMKFSTENIERIINNPHSGLTKDEVKKLEMGKYSLRENDKGGLTIMFH